MDKDEFEKRMRAQESFLGQQLLPGAWAIIRVDGRGFSRFTEKHFAKPFDAKFYALMQQTTQTLLTEMHGHFAKKEYDAFIQNILTLEGAAT